jgi:tetratricopeptide (TPR) repeat protein
MMIHHSVGALHFSRKAYFLAEAAFRAIDFPFLRETGNVHMQAMVLVSLGNSLLYQEQYREAAATLRDSVSLWRQLQDDLELANAIGSVGEALAALGNHAEAAAAFDEALALLAQFPTDARAGRLRTLFTAELEKVAGQTAP